MRRVASGGAIVGVRHLRQLRQTYGDEEQPSYLAANETISDAVRQEYVQEKDEVAEISRSEDDM